MSFIELNIPIAELLHRNAVKFHGKWFKHPLKEGYICIQFLSNHPSGYSLSHCHLTSVLNLPDFLKLSPEQTSGDFKVEFQDYIKIAKFDENSQYCTNYVYLNSDRKMEMRKKHLLNSNMKYETFRSYVIHLYVNGKSNSLSLGSILTGVYDGVKFYTSGIGFSERNKNLSSAYCLL